MQNPPTVVLHLPGASAALLDLARRGVQRSYPRGRRLIQEGDIGDTIYIILAGRLRAFSEGDNGDRITYATYGPGDYVGEMSLDGGPRAASVEAVERSTCVIVTRHTIQGYVAERPEFAFELLAKVIRRARAATLSARQMALNDVYGRLRMLLESRAGPMPDGLRAVGERLTHKDIAHCIGCSRAMVTRQLNELVRGGYMQVGPGGRLVLLRPLPTAF